ncbi:MAG: radical SAM protein [Bdellovibrionota bacterium]
MATNGSITAWEKTKAAFKWADAQLYGRPRLLNLEVTKKCNARCGFCPYWMTKTEEVLDDYAPVVQKFKPMVVTVSGGEPTLRKDIVEVVRGIKQSQRFVYVQMITNGSLMTEELAKKLFDAGLSQMTFSVDFPDERHDVGRGLPGNLERIKKLCRVIPSYGFDRVAFNTFFMKDNLDSVMDTAKLAYDLGVCISFSAYTTLKTDKDEQMVPAERIPEMMETVEKLIAMKRQTHHIRNSDHYLRMIPQYFAKGGIGGCEAGKKWIHVTADGHVKPCSELEVIAHYSDYTERDLEKANICDKCYFACRGESSAPVNLGRVQELSGRPNFGEALAF